MKVLFLTLSSSDSCAFYRSAGVIEDLRRKTDNEITLAQWDQVSMNWSFISQFDLVMFQRPFSKESLNLCGYIKQLGIKLWIDYDDNLFALNPENPTYHIYSNPEVQKNIKGMLKIADAVSVPTEYLKQAYSEFNKNITVIPNAFNDALFTRPKELLRRTNNVVWRGPEAHIYDLLHHMNGINKCLDEFSDWRFIFMGFDPDKSILAYFIHNTTNKASIPSMDIIIYFKTLLDMAPSCLHVPLHDNAFNRCKSNIAAIEGSYAGAVCVVPAWWNFPGTIPYTDLPSYYEAIRSVLSGDVDKEAMNKEAWTYIMDCLSLSKVNEMRINLINSLL